MLSTNYATENDENICNIFGAWASFRTAGPQYFYRLPPHFIVTVHHCFIFICCHLLKCFLAVTVQHIIISSVLNKLMVSLSTYMERTKAIANFIRRGCNVCGVWVYLQRNVIPALVKCYNARINDFTVLVSPSGHLCKPTSLYHMMPHTSSASMVPVSTSFRRWGSLNLLTRGPLFRCQQFIYRYCTLGWALGETEFLK